MRPGGYILDFAHSRQAFALFDDLLNGAVVAAGYNRDSRPARIETLAHGDRFNIETPRAEETDDPR